MSSIEPLPGFREFYPRDCQIRNFIFTVWRRVCRAHNFVEYATPTLQPTELFIEKSGPEIVGQLFNFTDKGEREVTLPAEVTPYVCQMVGAKAAALKRPLRWFSIPECFRYERAQRGRTRSFYQLNADVFDEASEAAEVELISLTIDLYRAFGLTAKDIVVRLSDRTLWVEYLLGLAVPADKMVVTLGIIDKWEREEPAEIIKKLSAIVGGEAQAKALREAVVGLMACQSIEALEEFLREKLSGEALEKNLARVASMKAILADLDAMGLADFVRVDFGVIRGLAYYTGFVFEVFDRIGKSRALAGGGRYDHLVKKLGGPDMPAMGMGMGDVTLLDILTERKLLPEFVDSVDFYLASTSPATRAAALKLSVELRDAGFVVELPLKELGFGKQMKAADKANAGAVIILGDDELAKGSVKVKDLRSGQEKEMPLEGLAKNLRG
jgi:histidyl-tRNA synthetase